MNDGVRVAGAGDAPADGAVVPFVLVLDGLRREAFAVRWRGRWHAWLDTCRHQSLRLTASDGHVFDAADGTLVCAHHGARYRPDTGECVSGPCRGAFLGALALEERDGALWCTGRAKRPGGDHPGA